jgi:hypothetical protein
MQKEITVIGSMMLRNTGLVPSQIVLFNSAALAKSIARFVLIVPAIELS